MWCRTATCVKNVQLFFCLMCHSGSTTTVPATTPVGKFPCELLSTFSCANLHFEKQVWVIPASTLSSHFSYSACTHEFIICKKKKEKRHNNLFMVASQSVCVRKIYSGAWQLCVQSRPLIVVDRFVGANTLSLSSSRELSGNGRVATMQLLLLLLLWKVKTVPRNNWKLFNVNSRMINSTTLGNAMVFLAISLTIFTETGWEVFLSSWMTEDELMIVNG